MNIPNFIKSAKFRRISIGIVIVILVLALVASIIFLIQSAGVKNHNVPVDERPMVTNLDFELDPGITYKNAVSDNALFFYSTENLKIINPKGELAQDLSLKFSHPAVATKGNLALFYDRGGRKLVLFNGAKEIASIETEENIVLATINKNGYLLLVTESNLHKCAVQVYDNHQQEIFKWNSGSLSVIAVDISDNNKDVTVSAVNTDEGTVKNQVIMFNIAKEKPFTNDTYEGDLLSVVRYSGSYVYCIGTANTFIYNGYGKCVGVVPYDQRELQHYALDNNTLALVFSGSSETSAVAEIKTYNQKGDAIGNFPVAQKFDFLELKDGTIVLNNGRTMSLLSARCYEKKQIKLNFDLRDFAFWGNNKKGIGVTASGAVSIDLH